MRKYYIYCTKNQAYHALLENSILSNALTTESFQAKSLSFLSKNFIFITNELVSPEMMREGCTDVYYPVVFEIEYNPEAQTIPAYLLYKKENASPIVSTTLDSLNNYTDECVGAFIFGEIPISMLSGILFASDADQHGFPQPAPDLWNPKHLYKQISPTQPTAQAFNRDDIEKAADELDSSVKDKADELNVIVRVRLKQKAEAYYLIDGTENWKAGKLIGNIDGYLKDYLSNELVNESIKNLLARIKDDNGSLLLKSDTLLTPSSENKDTQIFSILKSKIETDEKTPVDFLSLKTAVMGEYPEAKNDFDTIENFVYKHTIQDPDKVFSTIKTPGFKALAVFLDNQDDERLMKNACKKLAQEERRYAYILFAAHNGMKSVSGDKKKNEQLELRIEEITYVLMDGFPELISKMKSGTVECGFTPIIGRWFDENEARTILSEKTTDAQIEILCQNNWNKYAEINGCYRLKNKEIIEVEYPAIDLIKAEAAFKKLRKITKSHDNLILDIIKARDTLSTPKLFAKLYKSETKQIQEICATIVATATTSEKTNSNYQDIEK